MLHAKLHTACNKLSAATVIPDESFGEEFYDYISEFVEKITPPTPPQRDSPTPNEARSSPGS